MSGETVYILEAQPLNTSGVSTYVCFSAGLYNEAELSSATGRSYPVRLNQAFTHETSIFEENVPGQTSISLGSSTINNVDGRFDYLLDYAWDARPITIKRGKQGAAYNTYTTEFVGSTTEITADSGNLVLSLRDNSYKLAKPLQPNKYAGSGGAEGGVDLQNKTKPLLFGKTRNLSPVWVDQVLLIAQIHDGAITSVDAVYDRANSIKFQADYATYAALAAASISPGYYGTCLAGGYFRLGAPPAGALTVDAVGPSGGATNIPALAQWILTGRLGLTTGELDTAAFTQASTDAPWAFEGIFFQEPEDAQYDQFMETLSSSVNGFWYVTRAGLISFKIFKFNTPVATVRLEDIMSLGKAPSPSPLHRVKVNYAKNATVQPPSDFTIPKQLLNAYLDKMYHYVDTSVGSPDYSGAGKLHAFLNNTEINDMAIATFSVPNKESWISIDPNGNITVTAPPTSPASAVLRVNLGEFAWDETFTVVKDGVSPLNKIDLTLSTDRLYFDDAGQPSPSGQTVTITATGTNTTAPITLSAVDNLGNAVAISSNTIPIANVSKSILVQWVEVKAVDANGVQQRKRFIVQHGNDAYAQGILGSYSSATTYYFQGTAPTSGMQANDVWVNTSDANKTYRWTGSSWSLFSDTRIVDALTNAAGAQATADGKIKTYVSTTAPTGTFAVGDLWYNPNTQALLRWNGSSWADTVSTVGAQIGTNLTNGGSVVSGPAILNSGITINPDGSIVGAGGGQVTLGGLGYTGLWGAIGTGILISGNKLTNMASGGDGYTSAAVGRLTKGAVYVVADVYAVNGKVTVISLDDDATNYTLATQQYAVLFTYNSSTGHTIALYNNNTVVAGPVNIGTGAVKSVWLKYTDSAIQALTDATVRLSYVTGVTSGMTFYPKALLFNIGAVYDNIQYGASQVQPQIGTNLTTSTGSATTDSALLNSAISIGANGALSGAGGGQVTLSGVGYLGDVNATRNRFAIQATDPGFTEDGADWFDNSTAALIHRRRQAGGWSQVASYGARAGTNLYDSSLAGLTDSAIRNSSISISANGALSGAGGGQVTYGGLGGGAVGLQADLRLGGSYLRNSGGSILTDTSVQNSAVSIGSNGALSGAGGGQVTIGGLGGGPFATDSRAPNNLFRAPANLLKNGGFKNWNRSLKPLNWAVDPAWLLQTAPGNEGPYMYISGPQTNITQVFLSDDIPVYDNTTYTAAAELYATGMTSGSLILNILAYNYLNQLVGDYQVSATNGQPWQKIFNTVNLSNPSNPANHVKVRIFVVNANIASGQAVAARRVSFYSGSGEIPFVDEITNSVDQLTTQGTGVQIGDQRNLPAIASANARYRFTGSISGAGASSQATIDISSGTILMGGSGIDFTIAGTQIIISNPQPGVVNTHTYTFYISNPNFANYSGGISYTEDPNVVLSSQDKMWVGSITITYPTGSTQTSSTGGGGGGTGLRTSGGTVQP